MSDTMTINELHRTLSHLIQEGHGEDLIYAGDLDDLETIDGLTQHEDGFGWIIETSPQVTDEELIFRAQEQLITETHGADVAGKCNYGWAVDRDSVSTKVYGHGVLTSTIDPDTKEITHEWDQ